MVIRQTCLYIDFSNAIILFFLLYFADSNTLRFENKSIFFYTFTYRNKLFYVLHGIRFTCFIKLNLSISHLHKIINTKL